MSRYLSSIALIGTTASDVLIKKSATGELSVRLGDDSGLGALKAGAGTFSGLLTASAGLTIAAGQTILAAATGTNRIQNVTDPSSAQDAATKNYVDTNGSATSDWKQSVRVASVSNGTLATAFENGDALDGVTLVTGDRILTKAQTTVTENGIYTVNASGAPTRATDADSSTKLGIGARVYVEEGALNGLSTQVNSGTYTTQAWSNRIQFSTSTGSGGTAFIDGSYGRTTIWGASDVQIAGGTNTIYIDDNGIGFHGRFNPVAAIDFTASTVAAGGIAFGSNEFQLYRSATNTLKLNASSGLDMSSAKVTNVLDPTSAQDAATKAYVDSLSAGLDPKASVRAATTAAGTLASSFANASVIDGVTLATGNRILIKDQASGIENGIYTVNASGSPTRATDADSAGEVSGGMHTFVEEGTINADTGWVLTNDGTATLGSTALTFTQFSNAGVITAGNGLLKTGSSLAVVGTTNRISVSGAGVDISSAYVGQATITTLGTITTGVWTGTSIAVANGGTGATTAAGARTNLSSTGNGLPQKYTVAIGDGSTTAITVTHNLGTRDVSATVRATASPYDQVYPDITFPTTNTATFTFIVAPASTEYTVIVTG